MKDQASSSKVDTYILCMYFPLSNKVKEFVFSDRIYLNATEFILHKYQID